MSPHHSRPAQWRGHAGQRAALYLGALVLVGALIALTRTPDNDSADHNRTPATTGATATTTPPGADPTGDTDRDTSSTGDRPERPASQPLDQLAVPGQQWTGWSRYPAGHCAWIPPGLFDRLAPAAQAEADRTSCTVRLRSGAVVRITWGLPQSSARWHPTTPPTTPVAGLEAEESKPFLLGLIFPGACRLDINTGISGLTVVVWDATTAGDQCHLAETAATMLARALVPRAGGTPWPDTPQRPAPSALVGRGACGLLAAATAVLDPLDHLADLAAATQLSQSADEDGESCTATDNGVFLQVTITSNIVAPGRDKTPATSQHRIGALTARQQRSTDGCSVTVNIVPGHLLTVLYRTDNGAGNWCATTELAAAAIVQNILDRTAA